MDELAGLLQRARDLDASGQDDLARVVYLELLRRDPTHLDALLGVGNLAFATGRRAAARTAYEQAIRSHPQQLAARVNLGNLLYADEEFAAAAEHYRAALALSPELAEAHQGLARTLDAQGDAAAAEPHWQAGFKGRALAFQRYRGTATPVRVLLLVSVKLGNLGSRQFLDDRTFQVTAAHAEFIDPQTSLPACDVAVNAIGDADLCGRALTNATQLLERVQVPVINPPGQVQLTGRVETTRRLAGIPGVILPVVQQLPRAAITADALRFPVLLRAVGFHTGLHFERVEQPQDLAAALSRLPGQELLVIDPLDARGPDGLHRKYRVMIIGGELYPLHLAVSRHWKVHYFTGAMTEDPAYREEERRFLAQMPTVLGPKAMAALTAIAARLALDYAGVDFGLAADGSLLLFEANATMSILMPGPDAVWDYRRPSIQRALDAARRLVLKRAGR